jgi:hypothetical protein
LSDGGVYLCRHNNYLLAVGSRSMEFFYNAALSVEGSAFLRVDGAMQQIGAAGSRVCTTHRNVLAFLSSPNAIYLVADTKPTRISTPAIERLIDGVTITDAWFYGYESDGHSFLVCTFPTSAISLAYDLTTGSWYRMTDTAGGYFKIVNATELNGVVYGQHATDGYVYKFSGTQDNGVSFTTTVRTAYLDYGLFERKTCPSLALQADLKSGESLSIRYTDDDYVTWSTARTCAVTPRCRYWGWGQFIRRAWEISYAGQYDLRLHEMDIDLRE